MPNTLFMDLSQEVHLIKDRILEDFCSFGAKGDREEEILCFSKHLYATKYWFARVSAANKKRYVLALLENIQSAWALSLLLKSIWNCRPKDAVMSANESWSCYDQIPMDHNRTAMPVQMLVQVMKNDRKWFLTLDPEPQAMVLSELLTVAGGPIMWDVLHRAKILYDRYRDHQLQNIQECIVVNDPPVEKLDKSVAPDKGKKDQLPRQKTSSNGLSGMHTKSTIGQAQKELDQHLAYWNEIIKTMRNSLKLEELEITFTDGEKKKIWKVNRPKPEAMETVDFIQLLPSFLGKMILSYLPRQQLADYAKVNKYWAYLVDEFKAELAARLRIDTDIEKLQELMLKHDTSMDIVAQIDFRDAPLSSYGPSIAPSMKMRRPQPSMRMSEKSAGAYSFRHVLNDSGPGAINQTPIRNLEELTSRLDRRGAADENIWNWCRNILNQRSRRRKLNASLADVDMVPEGGVLSLGNLHFPCPLMNKNLQLPLHPPLIKDPAMTESVKPRRNISNATVLNAPKDQEVKRYSLWSRDFSSLYPVYKIPAYQSPV